ncbi:hypothetical protein [Peribacillus frigoritolerans]|uniref:hypothetical protein n=1 Tax=Peribacillus frigoritolerans TaxID=450367 RepID=UPI002E1A6337|nr:hypothetical protein [Peribacillus frigoritolerans]
MEEDIRLDVLNVEIVGGILTPPVEIIVDEENIAQNIVVIKDKIVNIGFIPITVIVIRDNRRVIPLAVNLPFQKETECPGACPGDTVMETPLQVEAVIIQPLPNVLTPIERRPFLAGLDVIRVKIILRTTITVVRPVIKSKDGCFSDVNQDRCKNSTPLTITLPVPTPDGG